MASMTIERPLTGVSGARPETIRRGFRAGIRRAIVLVAAAGIAATAVAPAALAVPTFLVTTPYPAVVVAPGAHVSFDISITTGEPQRVNVALTGAPASWNAAIHGGGFVVDEVQTNGKDTSSVRVDLDVPADATGTTNMILKASAGALSYDLPLVVRVDAKASGQLSLTSDVPSLKGPSTQTFSFNLTLTNGTAQDLTYSINAQGPTGWNVQATLTGQSLAASAVVKAGSTSSVTVSATPATGTAAGTYQVQVVATAAGHTETFPLEVDVTGTYTLAISTPGGVLNGHGAAGSVSPLAVTIANNGTAAITNVKMTGSGPSGWTITFDQPTVATLAAGQTVTVNAQIKPSGDAIAGDYNLTISAAGDASTTDSMQIRYTVETSILWGVVGVALIVAVVGGVWWVFQRYGRR